MPTSVSIRIPDNLKQEMDKHPEVNWSEVARQAMWNHLHTIRLADALPTNQDIDEEHLNELSDQIRQELEDARETPKSEYTTVE